MKWTIGILTYPARSRQFSQLMNILLPQVEGKSVEIIVFWNNGEHTLGSMRQMILEDAKGEYICFIDDDDLVPADYIDTILPLLDGVDYIGFKVAFFDNNKKQAPAIHSLKYSHWHQDENGFYRGITHLNPLRTELARESKFPVEYNDGEDAIWASHAHAETEHFIDREMYVYNHDADDVFMGVYGFKRPVYANKNVRFHIRSSPNAD